MRSRALLFVALLACVRLGSAQACAPQAVIVTVLNERGLPILDLPASSFRATSRGKSVSVLSASLRSDPSTRTYVLLDMSATMGGFGAQGIDKWKIARVAAADFLNVAPPQAEISLSTFSAAIEKTFQSNAGRKAMQDWLDSPESMRASGLKGKAAIYRAILETAKSMEPAHPGDSIFMITDGRNDEASPMAASVSDELTNRGIRLFSFVLDDSRRADDGIAAGAISESAPLPNPDAKILSALVKGAGGVGYTLYPGGSKIGQSFGASYNYDERTRQNVQASISEIEIAISHFYILSIALPGDVRGLQDWQLEVVDERGMKRKDVIVAYPAKIAGCQDSPAK
ncbi:MAG TPA: vWA domain-containing protein [Terriglobales bacterium]|nr:vWA domain-containing protein [Terriglobales bacterium]